MTADDQVMDFAYPEGDFDVDHDAWQRWQEKVDRHVSQGGRQVERKQWSVHDQYTRFRESEPLVAKKPVPSDECLPSLGWTFSYDIYNALDARKRGESRSINAKAMELVAGNTQEDKLFRCSNVSNGSPNQYLFLAEAVDFVRSGEIVHNPWAGVKDKIERPCAECGASIKAKGTKGRSAWMQVSHLTCQKCGDVLFCVDCIDEHHARHKKDRSFRVTRKYTAEELELAGESFDELCAVRDAARLKHETRIRELIGERGAQ